MIQKRQAGRLPHWRLSGGLYFVTFRLYDALPVDRVEAIRQWVLDEERRETGRTGRSLTPEERARIRARSTGRLDRALDEGHGRCLLLHCGAARRVQNVLSRGGGYRLHAFAVMPNHVHALVHPEPDLDLSSVVGAWKSVSARELIACLGVEAPVWQRESFDHLVRSEEKAVEYTRYILDNPAKAGLKDWTFAGSFEHGYENVRWPFRE